MNHQVRGHLIHTQSITCLQQKYRQHQTTLGFLFAYTRITPKVCDQTITMPDAHGVHTDSTGFMVESLHVNGLPSKRIRSCYSAHPSAFNNNVLHTLLHSTMMCTTPSRDLYMPTQDIHQPNTIPSTQATLKTCRNSYCKRRDTKKYDPSRKRTNSKYTAKLSPHMQLISYSTKKGHATLLIQDNTHSQNTSSCQHQNALKPHDQTSYASDTPTSINHSTQP